MRTYVYFIRPVGGGPVKIGCSHLPTSRLAAMTVWSPLLLEIVATIPGDQKLELRFHAAFKADWSHGEWFNPSERLDGVIDAIQSGRFNTDCLPAKGCRLGRKAPLMTQGRRLRLSLNSRMREPFRAYYTCNSLSDLAREAEFATPERQAEIVATIQAAIENPGAHAKPIETPWAIAHRARTAASRKGVMIPANDTSAQAEAA